MSQDMAEKDTVSQAEAKEGKKKSPLVTIIIIAVIIICFLGGVIIFLLTRPEPETAAESETDYNRVVTPDNVEEIISQMEEEAHVPAGSYEVSMSPAWVFPDGKSAATDAYVENSTANTNTVYFTIALSDTSEDIYRSPYLTVGSALLDGDIKLDTPLSKGLYEAIITYHLVDDEFNELSSISLYMSITIEN